MGGGPGDSESREPSWSAEVDWALFDDPDRLVFLTSLDEADISTSESLERVVRIAATASDTRYAQVSLVGTSQFVPASHGLTYEPAQQHTPISDSLCSITMAVRGPFSVPDTRAHDWTRSLPPVKDGDVAAYLGVPLYDPDGRPVGALCVFDSEPRTWRDEDEALLLDLAQLVTRELHLLAALETATVSEVRLRNAITDLVNRPKLGDGSVLRARAHYLFPAAAPAGGDWIDWIELPDRIAFSIGDVAGHGLAALRVMEELRHSMRAYALQSVGPADAIVKTSELLRQLRPGEMATAIKADFNPVSGRARFAVAGHPPPIHISDGRSVLVPVRPGPPLGTLRQPPHVAEIVLNPGDRLLLYTDGVFERRNEPITAGLARLLSTVERHAMTPDIELAVRAVLDDMVEDLHDDACLLLIERPHRH